MSNFYYRHTSTAPSNTMKALLFVCCAFLTVTQAKINEKYDLQRLPIDLKPVQNLVGKWRHVGNEGNDPRWLKPPYLLDFGINPIPKFGARCLNLTATFYDDSTKINQTDYAFLPTKNATKKDRRVHTALLYSSGVGYNFVEQGLVTGSSQFTRIRYHLKQFLKRTFDVGGTFEGDMTIDGLEREIVVNNQGRMQMTIQAITNLGQDDYTASYQRFES